MIFLRSFYFSLIIALLGTLEAHTPLDLILAEEFYCLKGSHDPKPSANIDYLIVLSGAHSYLQGVDCDDYQRIELAINIAEKIAVLRSGIQAPSFDTLGSFGPKIVYNGSPRQNQDLINALQSRILKGYPAENFIILDLPEGEINTKGQFISLKQGLGLSHTSVGIVTHAYHYPRIARMLGEKAPLYPFGEGVKRFVFLVDRDFISCGIADHIENEIRKIPIYIDKGDLSKDAALDIDYVHFF